MKKNSIQFAKGFTPPTQEECISALCLDNNTQTIPKTLIAYPNIFLSLPKPQSSIDWLARNNEPREDYNKWLASIPNNILTTIQTQKIYLQPIGDLTIPVEILASFVRIFYPNTLVEVLPVLRIENNSITITIPSTRRPTNKTIPLEWRHCHKLDTSKISPDQYSKGQYAVLPILHALYLSKPRDAFCVIGITMEDLYHTKSDSFTVGSARYKEKTAMFSFARYNPCFGLITTINTPAINTQTTLLLRSCKVLVHELGHLFGLIHCVWYDCCMNGSGNLDEDNRQPLHFCPVCLRKLQTITNCDLKQRYETLLAFYKQYNFIEEIKWQQRLLQML